LPKKKDDKRLMPGEPIATAEEYIAGFGTFEDNGMIYSSAIGSLDIDERNKVAHIKFDNRPNVVWDGDRVLCEVTSVRSTMVVCNIIMVEGQDRAVTGETMATIHVSKLSNRYVEDASEKVRVTDIVRGEVIQAKPSIQLTTAKPHLGVVYARCRHCREPLQRKDSKLHCEKCENTEYRKLSRDYRNIKF